MYKIQKSNLIPSNPTNAQYYYRLCIDKKRKQNTYSSASSLSLTPSFLLSMAFSPTASPFSHLQSPSLLPIFRLQHPLFLSPSSPSPSSFNAKRFDSRRIRIRVTASATATIESGNGALVTQEKNLDSISYGRQYFPLAAVVGQVKSHLSFIRKMVLWLFDSVFCW